MKHLLITVLLLSSALFTNSQTIVFDRTDHNWGNIHEEKGKVDATFYFTNAGSTPLVLTQVIPSCGCTATEYTTDSVKPNQSGFVKAIFDPDHKRGQFNKTITIMSNGQPSVLLLSIAGNVIARPKGPEDWYPTKLGGLRFNTNYFNFNTVKNNAKGSYTATIYNESDKTIHILGFEGRSYCKFIPEKMEIGPKQAIKLSGEFDGKLYGDLGDDFQQWTMTTDDEENPKKTIYVSAFVEQYFPKLSKKDSLLAPHVYFAITKFDFGQIMDSSKVTTVFHCKNTGKKNLELLRVKSSCGCTLGKPDKTLLKPGETTNIVVTYNPAGREGEDEKTVTIISNDPYNQTVVLKIAASVRK